MLSFLPVVAPGPRHPCGGRRRDDHLFLHEAPHGGAGAACAARRRFGSAWPRSLDPEVAGRGGDTRARAIRRARTKSGISLPHNRRWLARVYRCADPSRQHRVSRRSLLSDSGSRRVVLRSSMLRAVQDSVSLLARLQPLGRIGAPPGAISRGIDARDPGPRESLCLSSWRVAVSERADVVGARMYVLLVSCGGESPRGQPCRSPLHMSTRIDPIPDTPIQPSRSAVVTPRPHGG